MQRKLKIKVCGMRKSENIRLVAELFPEFLGFICFPGSNRYIGSDFDPDISLTLPETIIKTGVFVNQLSNDILILADQLGLSALQLHGSESPELCAELKKRGYTILKAFSICEGFSFRQAEPYIGLCDYFLFDTKTPLFGGSGKKFNWVVLEDYQLEIPFLLSGGIGPGDEAEVLALGHPMFSGIDLNSRFEQYPGNKDITLLKGFMHTIRNKG